MSNHEDSQQVRHLILGGNVKKLSDEQLITRLKDLVVEERRITSEVISLMREVESRHLYVNCGYSSLFEFCTRELGYSESAAYRRISAMKLAKEVPRASEAIRDGSMTLSAACALQSFLKNEEKISGKIYAPEQKEELFDKIQNKSRREIERLLMVDIPKILPPEKERSITRHHTEVRLIIAQDLMEKLDRLKNHLAPIYPNPSYAELFEILADKVLDQLDAAEKKVKLRKAATDAALEAPQDSN